jgi:hypothetical protein
MREIIFLVEEGTDGGFTARSYSDSIFTEGDNLEQLRTNVRNAVTCHFEDRTAPERIRLHFVREEVISL